jgi:predicted nucleotidyltransferase
VASQAPALIGALHRVHDDLRDLARGFALVGGLAVSARAEPRLTRDVDLVIATDDDRDAERVVHAMRTRGYRITTALEQVQTGRLATIRLRPPGRTELVVDLLFASSGIEPEIVEAADALEILPRLTMPVAKVGHLIAMKLLAHDDRSRPQYLDDIRALLRVASASDRRLVTIAIRQISKRGYARGRDLSGAWRAVRASAQKK